MNLVNLLDQMTQSKIVDETSRNFATRQALIKAMGIEKTLLRKCLFYTCVWSENSEFEGLIR